MGYYDDGFDMLSSAYQVRFIDARSFAAQRQAHAIVGSRRSMRDSVRFAESRDSRFTRPRRNDDGAHAVLAGHRLEMIRLGSDKMNLSTARRSRMLACGA